MPVEEIKPKSPHRAGGRCSLCGSRPEVLLRDSETGELIGCNRCNEDVIEERQLDADFDEQMSRDD